MRQSVGLFAATLALYAPLAANAQNPPTTQPTALDRPQRIAILRSDVEKHYIKWATTLPSGKQLLGSSRRDLTHAAHDLFVISDTPAAARQAELLITTAFDSQEMNPASPDYGTVPWNMGPRQETEDANAIEFTCLPLGAILTRYHARLSNSFLDQIKPHLAAALVAIRHHRVGVTYTNIYLMRITNLLLLGEATGDADATKLAMDFLDRWFESTRRYGIGEYNSPTYMETQINCATLAYDCTTDPAAKEKFKHVLDVLWADACASYDPATQQLGGASSRDYGFMDGTGPVDRYFFLAGLRTIPPVTTLLNDMSGPFCDAVETDYRPDDRMLSLGRNVEKEFRCGVPWPGPWDDRTYFSTAAFSLGSSATSYDAQDRIVGLRFGSGKPLPVISVFLDPYDKPDGSVREKGKDNHGKPVHWKMNGITVQDRGTVVGIEDLSSNIRNETASLGLNLILPAHADGLWLDGVKIDPNDRSDHPASASSIVIVREGNAAMAGRLFDVGGFAGCKPTYFLKHDIDGGKAFRLVAYAYQGEVRKLTDHLVPAGFVLQAETCPGDAQFADFVKRSASLESLAIEQKPGRWAAVCGSISLAFDPVNNKPIERMVNGADVHRTGLETVNGWDLSTLLPQVPSIAP